MSKKPPKSKPLPAPYLTDVMRGSDYRLSRLLGATGLRLNSPKLEVIVSTLEKWCKESRGFIEAYKSGRLTAE